MWEARKVKKLQAQMVELAAGWERGQAEIIAASEFAGQVVDGRQFSFNGAALIETRSKTYRGYAAAPIKIGGVKFAVGGSAPVRREEITVIDTGRFTIEAQRSSFVGSRHTRTWEYKKLVGYNVDASNEIIIHVSNRQRASGIRYDRAADFQIDAAFCAAVERFNGNRDAVVSWAKATVEELRVRNADAKSAFENGLERLAQELCALVGNDETQRFLRTLPGITLTPIEPESG